MNSREESFFKEKATKNMSALSPATNEESHKICHGTVIGDAFTVHSTIRNSNSSNALGQPLSSNLFFAMEPVRNYVSTSAQHGCTDMLTATKSSSLSTVDPTVDYSLHDNVKESHPEKQVARYLRVEQSLVELGESHENGIGDNINSGKTLNNNSKSCDEMELSRVMNHRENLTEIEMESSIEIANVSDVLGLNHLVVDDAVKGEKTIQKSESDKKAVVNKCANENSETLCQQTRVIHPDPKTKSSKEGSQRRSSLPPRACKIQSQNQRSSRGEYQKFGIREFNCGVCKETFSQKLLLKKHITQAHGRKVKYTKEKKSPSDTIMFLCPLCKGTYTRKHGFKRHFSSKHSNVKSIPCPECKQVAKNLQDYLNHTELHKTMDSKSPHLIVRNTTICQLKCGECQQVFHNNDAFKLHELNHNVTGILSQADSCFPTLQTSLRTSCHCHQSVDSIDNHLDLGQTFLGHLPTDVMTAVEQSVDTISKVTSRLDCLARFISRPTGTSSSVDEKLPQAVNFMNFLSSGLSSMSSTLGQVLLTGNGTKVKQEAVENMSNDDFVLYLNQCDGDFGDGQSVIQDDPITVGAEKCDNQNISEEKIAISIPLVKGKKTAKRGRRKLKAPRKLCKAREPHDHICLQCGKEFKNCISLRRHNITHQELRPYKCKVCKLTFRRGHHLKRHMSTHSDERPFKCDKCNFAAKTAKTIRTHSVLHDEAKNLPCEKCNFIGRTVNELSRHEKKHNPCTLCNYIPADDADYNIHKRSHLNFSCKECNYSCYSSWQLRRHSKKHNPPTKDQQKFCCELCGYSCFEKRQFDYHMTRHENKTPYSCSECDYKCSSRTSFDAHKLMHAGLKPYLCSICGASFRRTSYLNNHMLIHKDEKKHVCRTCGHPFRSRYNLKVHEMIHTGEKQFKCHLCHFACRRNKELRLHLEKHALLDQTEDVKPPLINAVKEEGV